MTSNLQKLVIDGFSSNAAQKLYCSLAENGLRRSGESLIDRYCKAGTRVLDLECGTGRTTVPMNIGD